MTLFTKTSRYLLFDNKCSFKCTIIYQKSVLNTNDYPTSDDLLIYLIEQSTSVSTSEASTSGSTTGIWNECPNFRNLYLSTLNSNLNRFLKFDHLEQSTSGSTSEASTSGSTTGNQN